MRCEICPRRCNAERTAEKAGGVCRMPAGLVVARAMLHLWEEPVLSGKNGAGCIFFSGCNLGCVFCQNGRISHENFGKVITPAHLREIMEDLIAQGAHCIDLVTPTHFTPWVLEALRKPLPVPVVWNSGGYERVETLRTLEGKVQIYLPDLKYAMERPARELSAAPDYFEAAAAAIDEMVRQVGAYQIGDDGLMRSGVILRHLVLPGQMENTKRVIDYVSTHFPPKTVLFSLMSQYTPKCEICPARMMCEAYKNGLTEILPVRAKKKARKIEERTVLLLFQNGKAALRKRADTGLLASLWEFPSVLGNLDEAGVSLAFAQMGLSAKSIEPAGSAKHIFTHIEWDMKGYFADVTGENDDLFWADAAAFDAAAIPTAFKKFAALVRARLQ